MKQQFYTLSLFLLLFTSAIQAQVSTNCNCTVDTSGLEGYLETINLNADASLQFSVPNSSAKFAVLHGIIDSNTPRAARTFINTFPNVTTLVFMQVPGSDDNTANLEAAKLLRAKGYTHYIPSVQYYADDAFIASGGTDLFLSGKRRVADVGAEIGVHSWESDNGVATDFPDGHPEHQPYIDYYLAIGFSQIEAEDFYYFSIYAATASDIYNMVEEDLEDFLVRTCKTPTNQNCGNTDGGNTGGSTTGGGNTGGGSTNSDKEWTYLVYLNGSDLESGGDAGTSDLAEMTSAGSTNNVNVIVTTGGANKPGWTTIKRLEIENGQQVPINFSARNNDMANTQNLTDFINWATETYPAEKVVLDLWNHGMDIRGYGHDENSDKEMKIPALRAAIANSNFIRQGKKFEIIGFDACLMATIEVQDALKEFGKYYVGSEETEPGHGWNYTPIIRAMENKSVNTGADLGRVIADGFRAQANAQGTENLTLSVVDLSRINQVVGALENLINAMQGGGFDMIQDIQQARSQAEEFSKSIQDPAQSEDMVDIGDFVKKLKTTAPQLTSQTNAVLSALNSAVLYNIKDNTRPNATGIAMFWPHNKIGSPDALESSLMDDYNPIAFSPSIQNYIINDYSQMASADSDAPDGEYYDYEDFGFKSKKPVGVGRRKNRFSAIKIPVTDDLEQVKVVLAATSYLENDDVVLLGSTLPDIEETTADGEGIFAYEWDGAWLGINGYPAYIADIFEFEVEQEDGTISYLTRVKIPAIINPDEFDEGKDVIISYFRESDEADFQLESIVPETYGKNVMLTAKERIKLKPGDRVMLLYEGYNETTDEEFYVVDDAAVFTIENDNNDLILDYDLLDYGDYVLGFQLQDLAQNDTVIFDPRPFVLSTATVETFAANNIQLFPNPTENAFFIDFPDFNQQAYQIQLMDLSGKLLSNQTFITQKATMNVAAIPNGYYMVKLISADNVFSSKLIIQR